MTKDTKTDHADLIKVAAVMTAAPRWAGALMAADGVPVPPEWLLYWRWAALTLSVGMAAAEGLAISYVFNAWRNQVDKRSRLLLWLAILMLADFCMILMPYIVAQVSELALAAVLPGWSLWIWAGAVAASTGLVVGSVGYAQKVPRTEAVTSRNKAELEPEAPPAGTPQERAAAVLAHTPDLSGDALAEMIGVSGGYGRKLKRAWLAADRNGRG